MNRRTFDALRSTNPGLLVLALAIATTRPVWSALRLRLLVRINQGYLSFPHALKIVYTGALSGAITPLRAGGISAEFYLLYRYSLPAGQALAVIALGACLSIILLLASIPLVVILSMDIIGLSFTVRGFLYLASGVGIIFLTAVIYSLRRPGRALDQILLRHSPRRLRESKRYQKMLERMAREVEGFGTSLRAMMRMGPRHILQAFLYTFAFWVGGFIVIPIVLAGMGYPELFVHATVGMMVVYTLLPFIPIPGAGGAGEAGFAAVFVNVTPTFLVGLLAIAWRFFDFYLSVLLGGIAALLALRDFRSAEPEQEEVYPVHDQQ